MSVRTQSDDDRNEVKSNLTDSIKRLQEVIFRRSDNQEYTEEYYSDIRKSLGLLNEAYELLF